MIQQRRKIDLKEVFCYPLGPVPWSLASVTGGMVKTNKTTLMHKLERGITFADAIPKPFASVIDGMVLVRQSNYIGLTYNEFADNISKFFAKTTSGASRSLSCVSIQLNEKCRKRSTLNGKYSVKKQLWVLRQLINGDLFCQMGTIKNKIDKIPCSSLGESSLNYWKLAVICCLRGEMHLFYS